MIIKLRDYLKRLGKRGLAAGLGVLMLTVATCSQIPHAGAQTAVGSLPSIYIPNPSSQQISAASGSTSIAAFGGIGAYTTCTATVTGTWSGTITFEAVQQDNSTWQPIKGADQAGVASGTTTTSNVTWVFACAGDLQWRARFSSYASGTANVAFIASVGNAVAAASSGGGGGGGVITCATPFQGNCPTPIPTLPPTPLPQNGGYAPGAGYQPGQNFMNCVEGTPSPAPSPGNAIVCSTDVNGYLNVDLAAGSAQLTGLSTPAPTPVPTAFPSALPALSLAYAQTGANQFAQLVSCGFATPIFKKITSSTDTLVLASGASTARVYVCGTQVVGAAANTGYFELSTSTSACSSLTEVTAPVQYIAQSGFSTASSYALWSIPVGDSLCFNTSASGEIDLTVEAVAF